MTAIKRYVFTLNVILCGATTLFVLGTVHPSLAQESRTWVDSSGQFKIEATFEKVQNDNVMLKLPDGELKQIPLALLSAADQDYVEDLLAPDPVPATDTPVDSSTKPSLSEEVNSPTSFTPATNAASEELATALAQPVNEETVSKEMVLDQQDQPDALVPQDPEEENSIAQSLTEADLKPPEPMIHIGQKIGDLVIDQIEIPKVVNGVRANPKYLLPVERNELALLPREFQGAALLLLEESSKPREAIRALDYLKIHWPKNRQPTLIKLVINCASSDHKYNRESALEILSDRDSDQSFPYIFARVDDTSFTIRSMAYQMLRKVGDRRAIEPLAKRFASDDVDRIASLLRSFGSDSEAAVTPYLTHEDPDIRLRACNLIGKIGTPKSLDALEQMMEREETRILKAQTRSSINKIKRRSESPERK